MTDNATRTAQLLALMKKGDDAFNGASAIYCWLPTSTSFWQRSLSPVEANRFS